ncbi:MAG: nodulation protein NfeD [Spirochaetales bacterium]|nr:nodulation protein NfeD [Spirochaetales bacterium]
MKSITVVSFSLLLIPFVLFGESNNTKKVQDESSAKVVSSGKTLNKTVVYSIPIHGDIDRQRMVFIKRAIKEAENAKAEYVIFDINTFGGRVDSALQIASLIGSVRKAVTVAYIPSSAEGTGVSWSAGALISFACGRIYMAPGTSIGAAAPVYETQSGMEMAPEKVVSAVRTQLAALAEKNGYPKAVALAMVDKDLEVYEVYINGKLHLALSGEIDELKRRAKERNETFVKGKALSQKGKLLSLTAGEMKEYGVSSGTPDSLESFYSNFNVDEKDVHFIKETAEDKLVALLTGSLVSAVLIIAGIIALYLEITSPGFGIPGTVAIICFSIVFISGALLGNVGSLELLLFILGVVLLIVEIFLIPGFGITGITGIILMVTALILSRQGFIFPSFEWQWDIFKQNLLVVGGSVGGAFIILAALMPILPKSRLFNRLVLETGEKAEKGFTVQTEDVQSIAAGEKGRVVTTLRPVGKAEINGRVYVVQAEADFINRGSDVEVVEIAGNKIVVRKLV